MKILLVLALVTVNLATIYSVGNIQSGLYNPKLVASVDGKSFYADKTITRNWTAAGDYCRSFGMELAEVTSIHQMAALDAAYSLTDFHYDHWTAGRDSQDTNQFRWNNTKEVLVPAYIKFMPQIPLVYQTCVMFFAMPNNASGFTYWPCFDGTSAGVLCQSQ